MKLVVCYTHGGYESTWTENLCVEYESKDHFLVAFIDAFEAWAEHRKERARLQKCIHSATDTAQKLAAFNDLQNYQETYGAYQPIIVDDMIFDNFEDFEKINGEYILTKEPEVYTLDEWFEMNRPEITKKA